MFYLNQIEFKFKNELYILIKKWNYTKFYCGKRLMNFCIYDEIKF